MSNAEDGPGPTTVRIKLNGSSATPSQAQHDGVVEHGNHGGLSNPSVDRGAFNQESSESAPDQNLAASQSTDHQLGVAQASSTGLPVASAPLRGRGSRGGPGSRGRGRGRLRGGRGPGRPPLDDRQRRQNPTRSAGAKASSQIRQQGRDESEPSTSRKVTLSFNKSGAGIRLVGESARKSSFLGDYDRDLDDNPTEPLAFEEQFLLRVPERIASNLRERVKGKTKGLDGVEFKFLDSRRAAFKFEGRMYSSKLVDLPNIIESQKTFDSRHLFKVADISQMLVVDEPIEHESIITSTALNVDDYVWPHGMTPPLRHVRKRRFRKRISRRAIEVVEENVEELLKKDEDADETQTDLIDTSTDPDAPDSYYIEYDPDAVWYQQDGNGSEYGGSEMYEDPGSAAPQSDWDGEQAYYDDQTGEDDYGEGDEEDGEEGEVYDDDLAAALREELQDGSDEEEGSDQGGVSGDDEDEEGARSEDEEDDEAAERKTKIKQYNGEIKVLETTIEKKRNAFKGGNPIMVKRFEETLAGLQADINTKINARQSVQDELDIIIAAKAKPSTPAEVNKSSSPKLFEPSLAFATPTGEVERDDVSKEVGGTATGTREASFEDDDDDDDLFGDGDDDAEGEEEAVIDTAGSGAPLDAEAMDVEEASFEEGGDEEIDAEMAAILDAELGTIGGDASETLAMGEDLASELPQAQFIDAVDVDAEGLEQLIRQNAALDYDGSAASGGFGVEGGVGMRRLATGVMEDDEDADSDTSGSTD